MIYPRRDNIRAQRKRRIAFGILIACLIFVIVANIFFPHIFSPFAHTVGVPLLESRASASDGATGLWGILHSKLSLIQENRNLREQLALLKATQAERDSYKAENETLREFLGRATSTDPGVLAHVLSKPSFSPYDTLIIDAGSAEHIQVGDSVLVDESVIVGKVTSVSLHSSNVSMYSAPDEKNQVFIGSKSLEATATGKGGGVFEIRLPKNAGVEEGDVVTLAEYPNFVFGSISHIDDTPTDSFERLLFTSPVDIDEISYVTVHSLHHENISDHR